MIFFKDITIYNRAKLHARDLIGTDKIVVTPEREHKDRASLEANIGEPQVSGKDRKGTTPRHEPGKSKIENPPMLLQSLNENARDLPILSEQVFNLIRTHRIWNTINEEHG